MVNFIKPYNTDPFVGHLATPITTSAFTRAFLRLLPAYRPNLTPLFRGTEIGFTHGYFLVGPFYAFGPLRSTEFSLVSLTSGLLASITLIFILSVAASFYGRATYPSKTLNSIKPKKDEINIFKTLNGWQIFAEGFFTGGVLGSIVAALGIAFYSSL